MVYIFLEDARPVHRCGRACMYSNVEEGRPLQFQRGSNAGTVV